MITEIPDSLNSSFWNTDSDVELENKQALLTVEEIDYLMAELDKVHQWDGSERRLYERRGK